MRHKDTEIVLYMVCEDAEEAAEEAYWLLSGDEALDDAVHSTSELVERLADRGVSSIEDGKTVYSVIISEESDARQAVNTSLSERQRRNQAENVANERFRKAEQARKDAVSEHFFTEPTSIHRILANNGISSGKSGENQLENGPYNLTIEGVADDGKGNLSIVGKITVSDLANR